MHTVPRLAFAIGLAGAAGALALPQGAFAASSPGEVTYEVAIRCAAVDTLASTALDGEDASDAEKGLAKHYDGMVESWVLHAASLTSGGQEQAIADYVEAATKLSGEAAAAKDEAELQALVGDDLARCGGLEEALIADGADEAA